MLYAIGANELKWLHSTFICQRVRCRRYKSGKCNGTAGNFVIRVSNGVLR